METENLKCKTKEFFNKNKKKIRICAELTFAIAAGTIIVSQRKMIIKLVEESKKLKLKNVNLKSENTNLRLENEQNYKKLMAARLREGSSEAGRAMRNMRCA